MTEYNRDRAIWEVLWFLKRASNPLEGWEKIPSHELVLQLRNTLDKTVCEGALSILMHEYGLSLFNSEGLE